MWCFFQILLRREIGVVQYCRCNGILQKKLSRTSLCTFRTNRGTYKNIPQFRQGVGFWVMKPMPWSQRSQARKVSTMYHGYYVLIHRYENAVSSKRVGLVKVFGLMSKELVSHGEAQEVPSFRHLQDSFPKHNTDIVHEFTFVSFLSPSRCRRIEWTT